MIELLNKELENNKNNLFINTTTNANHNKKHSENLKNYVNRLI